uniref:Uncharacterized protein n=1 Tax=Arundo donax TaxID=35708 RepID=A0A0A9AFS3_ARUDO
MNSLFPCLDSGDTRLIATLCAELGSTPLYTLPNPPLPSSILSLNLSVAVISSL